MVRDTDNNALREKSLVRNKKSNLQPVSLPHQVFPLLFLPEQTDSLALTVRTVVTITVPVAEIRWPKSIPELQISSVFLHGGFSLFFLAQSLRESASLHLSDLPLSLSLPLPLSLLLDLVKGQDVFLLLTG